MAIHYPTPPLCGGERPRLPSAQVGPVTQAIRAMRAAEPVPHSGFETHFNRGIRALSRSEVEDLIGSLINLLDAIDGDADHEPDVDREPSLCGVTVSWPYGADDDRENDMADHEASHQPLHMGGGGFAVTSFGRAA